MTRQNNQNTIGDVARRNNHKYCRRHGFGENTDCGNRGEIKSWCWGTSLSPLPFTRNDWKTMNTTACSTVQKIAGTFLSPCGLVFVTQDRQLWVAGPLHKKINRPKFYIFIDGTLTHRFALTHTHTRAQKSY